MGADWVPGPVWGVGVPSGDQSLYLGGNFYISIFSDSKH